MLGGPFEPVIEFVSEGSASAHGIGCSCTGDPWVTFAYMLVVAVVIGMACVETVLGTVELNLVPFAPLCVLYYVPAILVMTLTVGHP